MEKEKEKAVYMYYFYTIIVKKKKNNIYMYFFILISDIFVFAIGLRRFWISEGIFIILGKNEEVFAEKRYEAKEV